jgi:hypothetical protein
VPRRGDPPSGNGRHKPLYPCGYGCGAKFTTLDARMQHVPSCLLNPDRVPERDNPERWTDGEGGDE